MLSFSHHREGNTVTFQLAGVLDAMSAPTIGQEIERTLAAEQQSQLVFDLSSLRLIDSRGIALLVAIYKRAHAAGQKVAVTGLRSQPLAMFKLLRLDRLFS